MTRTRSDGDRRDGDSSGRNHHRDGNNAPPRDSTAAPRPERSPAAERNSGGYATRSDLHRRDEPRSEPVRHDSSRTEAPARSNDSYSAPARSESSSSPPVSRSESSASSSSSSNQSQREANQAAAQRERLE